MVPEELVGHLLDTIPAEEVWGEVKKALPRLPTAVLVSILENAANENAPAVIAQIRGENPKEVVDKLLNTSPAEEVWGKVREKFPRLTNQSLIDILENTANENAPAVIAQIRNEAGTAIHPPKRLRGEDNLQAEGDDSVCRKEECAEIRQCYKRGFNMCTAELLEVQQELVRVQEARNAEVHDARRELIRVQEASKTEVHDAQRELFRVQEARNAGVLDAQREVIETLKELVSVQARYIARLE